MDRSPAEVVATLLDEEVYLCSERTMYRVLASEVPVQERRAQRTHPEYKKPELMATAPNQVWSWDITRLLGPKKWSYYYLYVIMDIYSRYVVGWMVADRENSALAGRLIQQSCLKHGVQPRVLTLHSDRGAPMTSQCTAQLLADLGVTRSLSRPQVSDDNPFSEAQFKTLKYHPSFPGQFGDQGQAKTFCRSFFRWYNAEHRHGGISMLTPEQDWVTSCVAVGVENDEEFFVKPSEGSGSEVDLPQSGTNGFEPDELVAQGRADVDPT